MRWVAYLIDGGAHVARVRGGHGLQSHLMLATDFDGPNLRKRVDRVRRMHGRHSTSRWAVALASTYMDGARGPAPGVVHALAVFGHNQFCLRHDHLGSSGLCPGQGGCQRVCNCCKYPPACRTMGDTWLTRIGFLERTAANRGPVRAPACWFRLLVFIVLAVRQQASRCTAQDNANAKSVIVSYVCRKRKSWVAASGL